MSIITKLKQAKNDVVNIDITEERCAKGCSVRFVVSEKYYVRIYGKMEGNSPIATGVIGKRDTGEEVVITSSYLGVGAKVYLEAILDDMIELVDQVDWESKFNPLPTLREMRSVIDIFKRALVFKKEDCDIGKHHVIAINGHYVTMTAGYHNGKPVVNASVATSKLFRTGLHLMYTFGESETMSCSDIADLIDKHEDFISICESSMAETMKECASGDTAWTNSQYRKSIRADEDLISGIDMDEILQHDRVEVPLKVNGPWDKLKKDIPVPPSKPGVRTVREYNITQRTMDWILVGLGICVLIGIGLILKK